MFMPPRSPLGSFNPMNPANPLSPLNPLNMMNRTRGIPYPAPATGGGWRLWPLFLFGAVVLGVVAVGWWLW